MNLPLPRVSQLSGPSFETPECPTGPSVLILRSHSVRNGVSKDGSGGSRTIWDILRDAAARLLRMRAELKI
jgi:hypothetical protein